MNIASMARWLLALLMMRISWPLVGFDVLENPTPFELNSSRAPRLPDHGQTAKPSKDFVHSSDHWRLYSVRFCGVASGSATDWLYGTLVKARETFQLRRAVFDCWKRADGILKHSVDGLA
jgi:hypothetical protein